MILNTANRHTDLPLLEVTLKHKAGLLGRWGLAKELNPLQWLVLRINNERPILRGSGTIVCVHANALGHAHSRWKSRSMSFGRMSDLIRSVVAC